MRNLLKSPVVLDALFFVMKLASFAGFLTALHYGGIVSVVIILACAPLVFLLERRMLAGLPRDDDHDDFRQMVKARWIKEETPEGTCYRHPLATEFYNVVLGAPATEEGDKDTNFYADLITWYPADRKTGTLFHDGWSGYENIVKTLTLYGFHARDIIKLPIGWKYPYYADCRYNDGLLAHADAFKRAYYQRRHLLKLARRKYMKQVKRDRIRWIDYGWAKAKREWKRFEREMAVREASK
ncbi:hypothetical protein LH464_22925 [Neorhizobium sp. T786]|uniref:hypothetical protein n=1 Tax=Pseudorhizobium xiangyangii TaxID=2883104 RepID=UPI001CFF7C7F|nr:hypothetical protein [Neorhizobium xiangyangii]MCB5205319.1 hypothetical protein [Neorhizobium xiangyangii]